MKKTIISLFLVLTALSLSANGEENYAVKIKMTVGNKVLNTTMLDNATSRDFVSMLPMTLRENTPCRGNLSTPSTDGRP